MVFVTNIQGLRSISNPTQGMDVVVGGYYVQNDGGGGTFIWDATSTTPGDDGTIIPRPGNPAPVGRWKRIYDGMPNAKWFGVRSGDGTDQAVQLRRAVQMATSGLGTGSLFIPKGIYNVAEIETEFANRFEECTFVFEAGAVINFAASVTLGAVEAPKQQIFGSESNVIILRNNQIFSEWFLKNDIVDFAENNRITQYLKNISELRTIKLDKRQSAYIQCHSRDGDGGEGYFYWGSRNLTCNTTAGSVNITVTNFNNYYSVGGFISGNVVKLYNPTTNTYLQFTDSSTTATITGLANTTTVTLSKQVSTSVQNVLLVHMIDDNNGTVINPPGNTSHNRWLRNGTASEINVRWFGCKADNVNDDTAAIQSAFNLNKPVYIPRGLYKVTNLFYGSNSTSGAQSLHGAGIRGDFLGTILTALPGTTGYVLNVKAASSLYLTQFVIDAAKFCGCIDTSWPNGNGVSQQNVYTKIRCVNWLSGPAKGAIYNVAGATKAAATRYTATIVADDIFKVMAGGTAGAFLNGLTGTSLAAGDFIQYNGTSWAKITAPEIRPAWNADHNEDSQFHDCAIANGSLGVNGDNVALSLMCNGGNVILEQPKIYGGRIRGSWQNIGINNGIIAGLEVAGYSFNVITITSCQLYSNNFHRKCIWSDISDDNIVINNLITNGCVYPTGDIATSEYAVFDATFTNGVSITGDFIPVPTPTVGATPRLFGTRTTNGSTVLAPNSYKARAKITNTTIGAALDLSDPVYFADGLVHFHIDYENCRSASNPSTFGRVINNSTYQVGQIALFGAGFDNASNGWELCNGQALGRQTFVWLFSVIGTTYGVGDGSSTFNLPTIADVGLSKYYIFTGFLR